MRTIFVACVVAALLGVGCGGTSRSGTEAEDPEAPAATAVAETRIPAAVRKRCRSAHHPVQCAHNPVTIDHGPLKLPEPVAQCMAASVGDDNVSGRDLIRATQKCVTDGAASPRSQLSTP